MFGRNPERQGQDFTIGNLSRRGFREKRNGAQPLLAACDPSSACDASPQAVPTKSDRPNIPTPGSTRAPSAWKQSPQHLRPRGGCPLGHARPHPGGSSDVIPSIFEKSGIVWPERDSRPAPPRGRAPTPFSHTGPGMHACPRLGLCCTRKNNTSPLRQRDLTISTGPCEKQ